MTKERNASLGKLCICIRKSEVRDGMLYIWYEFNANCPVLYIHGTPKNPKPVRV